MCDLLGYEMIWNYAMNNTEIEKSCWNCTMNCGGIVNYIEIVKCIRIMDSVGVVKCIGIANGVEIVVVVWIIGE